MFKTKHQNIVYYFLLASETTHMSALWADVHVSRNSTFQIIHALEQVLELRFLLVGECAQ